MMMTHGANIARSPGTNMIGKVIWKEWNVLFNDALNTCYLRLYGVRHKVKDHSDSERGKPLPPHGLLFPIREIAQWVNHEGSI